MARYVTRVRTPMSPEDAFTYLQDELTRHYLDGSE